ncbi:VOC family protein [Pedobacter endophyticus]|nr:VOC family protein [Pedobacter endophyticus]
MKQIIINLPVKDLQKSVAFYKAIGFEPQYADESTTRLLWSEHISLMIMQLDKFANFATKPIADTSSTMAGYFSLTVESIEEMNDLMTKGLEAGGTESSEKSDYGFMQQRTLEDLDGHTWNLMYIDLAKMPTAG